MNNRSFGIMFISGFYIFGGIVLLFTAFFTNPSIEKFGIATRLGVPWFPEFYARVGLALLAFIMAYGLLKLTKWGFWFFVIYNIYFFIVSANLYNSTGQQLFSGNLIWSLFMIFYMFFKRKDFTPNNRQSSD